jgi:SAM-dependent methyltransferase
MERETHIEAVLRSHPGVRESRAVRSENLFKALVIPEDSYVEEALGFGGIAAKVTGKWRKVFDLTQFTKQAASAPVGFNTLGWNSSYTRHAFPPDEIRDWVESMVEEIRSLAPKRVYEIGCGTGMLLIRIAPHCERYLGSDFSPAVLASLEGQLSKVPGLADRVQVLERAAADFDGLDPGPFDTVIINSVVQYFPSMGYLTQVLNQALSIVKDGGHIFVGDVLSLALENLFATSVVLFQATGEVSVAELRDRIHRRVAGEPQLILSPAYFLSLKHRFPRVAWVEIRPRRDRADTEMSRYRYNAILHIGHPQQAPVEIEFLDWTASE